MRSTPVLMRFPAGTSDAEVAAVLLALAVASGWHDGDPARPRPSWAGPMPGVARPPHASGVPAVATRRM